MADQGTAAGEGNRAGEVQTDLRGDGVLLVSFNLAPANALTPGLRGALLRALDEADGPAVRAVVLTGAGRNFSAATSVDTPKGQPTLAELCARVEGLPVPVVAVLQGAAVGPGAELAIAAHARVAQTDARIILPEVSLGLVPEGGTTQRLPRLVGAAEALEMLLKARAVTAVEGLATGLVDHAVDTDPLAAGIAFALSMAGPRPARDRMDGLQDFAAFHEAVAAARTQAARGVLPAPGRIIDCVEAAMVLPFENGLALEEVAREDLEDGAESQGLRSAALAERRAAVLPAPVARIRPKTVATLGLLGGAPQMAAFAMIALGHGLRVQWADPLEDRRAASIRWIAERQDAELRAGRLTAVQRDADRARLSDMADLRGLAGCDLVLHAAAGDAVVQLSRMLPGAPQLVLGGAEGQFGLALAPSARVSELALPSGPAPDLVAVSVQFLRRLGIPPVLVGKMPILGRRVVAAGRAALARMLAMGVPRRVLAQALDQFGQAMPDVPDPAEPAPMRAMSEDEVLKRWQGAMANEGLRMLDALVARRPSDVDMVLVAGHGFPRWRGGPMHHAAGRGLMVLRRDLRAWKKDDEALWSPHPLLDRMIAEGRTLADLDG